MTLADLAQAYFQAYLFWLGLPLGALFFLALHRLTGGRWGRDLALPLRASLRTLPLMAVLFIPILFVMREIYPWVPGATGVSHGPAFHPQYLSINWFIGRVVFYFIIWLVLGWKLKGPVAHAGEHPARGLPAATILLLFVTVSFAAIDWTMSLTEHWFSSVYGLIVLTSAGLTALSVAIWSAATGPNSAKPPEAQGNLASLLMVTLMACGYAHFSQLIIMWSGNKTKEMVWYNARYTNGWQVVSWMIVFGAFALPFLLLLFRRLKRERRRISAVTALILVGQALTNYWFVVPSLPRGATAFRWVDAVFLVALGLLWLFVYLRALRRVQGEVYG